MPSKQGKIGQKIFMDDFTAIEIPEWTGSHLSYGAFLSFAQRIAAVTQTAGYDVLSLEKIGPAFSAAVERFAAALSRHAAFDGTPAVAAADARRDALWLALWSAWRHVEKIGGEDEFCRAARRLRSEMMAAKGLYLHEMTRQTAEIETLRRELAKEENAAALQTLGLDKIAAEMFAADDAWREAVGRRTDEQTARIAARAAVGTSESLRKEIAALLAEVFRSVNAVNRLHPTEATRRAAADIMGVMEHYRIIAARPAKKRGRAESATEQPPSRPSIS